MPDAPEVFRLSTDSLFSKWGFNDGDEPDWLLDALEERGIDWSASDTGWHDVLHQLVVEHLVPVLSLPVEVYRIETIHNPVRVDTVAGVELPWEVIIGDQEYDGPPLRPDHVDVPLDVVIRAMGLEIVQGEVMGTCYTCKTENVAVRTAQDLAGEEHTFCTNVGACGLTVAGYPREQLEAQVAELLPGEILVITPAGIDFED